MDVLAQVLDRVRLGGTLLFHFELGHPWNLELPERPYALFHYLSRGSATLALEEGRDLDLSEGDFVVVTRGEPHTIYSDRQAEPLSIFWTSIGRRHVSASFVTVAARNRSRR